MTTNLPVIDPVCAFQMDIIWGGADTYRIVKRQPDAVGGPWHSVLEQVPFDEVAMEAARGRCDDN